MSCLVFNAVPEPADLLGGQDITFTVEIGAHKTQLVQFLQVPTQVAPVHRAVRRPDLVEPG